MPNLRDNVSFTTITPKKPGWAGNALFILACAAAAAAATILFAPMSSPTNASYPALPGNDAVSTDDAPSPTAPKVTHVSKVDHPPALKPDQPPNSLIDAMSFKYRDDPKLAAMTDLDLRSIYAHGVITVGTADRFAHFLRANTIAPGALVIFDSPGGLVAEAIKLGSEIRAAGLNTSVQEIKLGRDLKPIGPIKGCFSACTFAFLGGVERFVGPNALFGVHQVSVGLNLTSRQALQLGQSVIGIITEYASSMGVKPEFIYQLTRVTPDGINILSEAQMSELNVTTPEFQTNWQIATMHGNFYLLGATQTHGGLDNLLVLCGQTGPVMLFMLNTSGHYKQDTLDNTTDYGFEFDHTHMDLLPSEIVEPVKDFDNYYVTAVIALSPRILDSLQTANNLTFEMMSPSHLTYAGWTTDFANGRDQFFSFLKSCHQ